MIIGGFEQAANSMVRPEKETTGKLGNGQLLSGCGFAQNIAPPSLVRDRRIKMEQINIMEGICAFFKFCIFHCILETD